jgi:ferritin-like protein
MRGIRDLDPQREREEPEWQEARARRAARGGKQCSAGSRQRSKRVSARMPRRATNSTIVIDEEQTMSSVGYHEPVSEMSDETRDMHRAIVSLMEELEAVDWYNQRADAARDPELRAILVHNRDEEKEHAAMVLEWIRRKDPTFSKELKDFLFTATPIAHQ